MRPEFDAVIEMHHHRSPEGRDHTLGDNEVGAAVDLVAVVEIDDRCLLDVSAELDTGVRPRRIDAAERGDRGRYRILERSRVGDIDRHRHRTQLTCQALQSRLLEVQ